MLCCAPLLQMIGVTSNGRFLDPCPSARRLPSSANRLDQMVAFDSIVYCAKIADREARAMEGGGVRELQKRVGHVVNESRSRAPAHVRRTHGADVRRALGHRRSKPGRLPFDLAVAF